MGDPWGFEGFKVGDGAPGVVNRLQNRRNRKNRKFSFDLKWSN